KLYLRPTTFRQLFQLSVHRMHRSSLLWQRFASFLLGQSFHTLNYLLLFVDFLPKKLVHRTLYLTSLLLGLRKPVCPHEPFLLLFLLSVHKTHRSYLLWQMIYSPIFSLLILHDDVNGNRIALLHTDNQLLLLQKLFSSLIFLLAVGYHRNLKYDP